LDALLSVAKQRGIAIKWEHTPCGGASTRFAVNCDFKQSLEQNMLKIALFFGKKTVQFA